MITVRKARPADAIAIGAVHVAVWRSTYPGILPDRFLARLSVSRQAAHYDAAIRGGTGVLVAIASGEDVPGGQGWTQAGGRTGGGGTRIIGFTTAGPSRTQEISGQTLGDGELETLYVLDDWRDQGVGRMLMRGAAEHLMERGCRSSCGCCAITRAGGSTNVWAGGLCWTRGLGWRGGIWCRRLMSGIRLSRC